jgi:hypothetical protein
MIGPIQKSQNAYPNTPPTNPAQIKVNLNSSGIILKIMYVNTPTDKQAVIITRDAKGNFKCIASLN